MNLTRSNALSRSLVLGASRRRLLTGLVGGVLAVPRPAAVSESMTFDPATGTGFFDSGIVLFQLGWDQERIQNEATALGFILAETAAYSGLCSTGGVVSTVARTDTILENDIQYDGPVVTGFTLTGKAQEIRWQFTPWVGASCVEDNVAGTWRSVEQTSHESHLYIGYKGIQVHLWPGSGPGILRDDCR